MTARISAVATLSATLGTIAGAAFLVTSTGVWAEEQMPMETSCTLSGWTNNDATTDIPIHSDPASTSNVVGHLPLTPADAETTTGDRLYSVRFDIAAFLNGWFRLENISDAYNAGTSDRVLKIKVASGWVRSNDVRFRIQSPRGYAAAQSGYDVPKGTTSPVVNLGDDWASDLGDIENIIACNGPWALVDLRIKRRRQDGGGLAELRADEQAVEKAWFRGICGNEETTCDMPLVDSPH